ncbi:MAG TPA: phosphoribosylglycinamide formyltransferase [Saprospiraceae bacterium]|nr:phosphoribosylglycinamide formyltransferase [Saprospiraceae bacterium]
MHSGDTVRIAIFASGAGSNALKIIQYFTAHPRIKVAALVCNNPHAGVLAHAHAHHIPVLLITRRLLNDRDWFLRQLESLGVDDIVLAGFLLLMPEYLIDAFPQKIINIHPALLPKYGGKGMYGMHVHEAVKESGDPETGITIHLVNKQYDEGEILFQKRVAVDSHDTPEQIAQKVHALEHDWYPKVIEEWVSAT